MGGKICTVLRLRLMRKLAMCNIWWSSLIKKYRVAYYLGWLYSLSDFAPPLSQLYSRLLFIFCFSFLFLLFPCFYVVCSCFVFFEIIPQLSYSACTCPYFPNIYFRGWREPGNSIKTPGITRTGIGFLVLLLNDNTWPGHGTCLAETVQNGSSDIFLVLFGNT